ncbi:MAG: hypothetical protein K6F99_00860, partial [Lachnospiraceae bacterium]|nr:hypothetical protein [Lachnospiraceae bacterium]
GIFIISLLILLYYFIKIKDSLNIKLLYAALTLSSVAFICFISDGGWWARFTPYVYLLTILALTILFRFSKGTLTGFFRVAVIIILILNSLVFWQVPVDTVNYSQHFIEQFKAFRGYTIDYDVSQYMFYGKYFDLDDNGIKYNVVTDIDRNRCDGILYEDPFNLCPGQDRSILE